MPDSRHESDRLGPTLRSGGPVSGAAAGAPGKRTLVEGLVPAGAGPAGVAPPPDRDTRAHDVAARTSPRPGSAAAGPGDGSSVQRTDDAAILEHQARLKGTDVEIPALEGALLATRQEAVIQGLLSKPSFDASLALSRAMTKLQPAAAVHGTVDGLSREVAAVAAQQLFFALQRETANHFKIVPSPGGGTAVTSQNPYTDEVRLSTYFVQNTASTLERLPALIRQGKWDDAFRDYRRMLDGLDRWVADRLRQRGKGTAEEALGNAQEHHAQLRTGLEQIAGKHAKRLPAIFHPDPDTVAKERSAGRPGIETIPMNVYFWKDDADGKYHLYDLTTPSRPHTQAIDGPPTAASLSTFFEDVARYPEGEVRYTLPEGGGGVAQTTGKTKWYEWVAYAALAIAAVGLALATAGASVPATYCFAAGAIAGGLSAAGHLADTARLGTATTATVILDVAQVATSFASFGALSITLRAGSAASALASSRWFVPLVTGAAAADSVQLVALTDVTFVELTKIQQGAGTPEDKQRAMSVLLTQLVVVGSLTALSVQGARSVHALAGRQLEVVEQNGATVLRVAGEDPTSSTGRTGSSTTDAHSHASRDVPEPTPASRADANSPSNKTAGAERWLITLEAGLNPEEQAKLAKMKAGKTPGQMRDMLGADLEGAQTRVRTELRLEQDRAAVTARSKQRVADLRKQITDRGLMRDPDIQAIVDGTTADNANDRLPMLRDNLMAKIVRTEAKQANVGAEVMDGVKIYEKLPEASLDDWAARNPGKRKDGLIQRSDGLYMQRGEIDIMIVERQSSGKARILSREEIKTGVRDFNSVARGQLDDQRELLGAAAAGRKVIRLEMLGHDITAELDLGSDAAATAITRGPAGKGFDESLGISANDLQALCKELLAEGVSAARAGE